MPKCIKPIYSSVINSQTREKVHLRDTKPKLSLSHCACILILIGRARQLILSPRSALALAPSFSFPRHCDNQRNTVYTNRQYMISNGPCSFPSNACCMSLFQPSCEMSHLPVMCLQSLYPTMIRTAPTAAFPHMCSVYDEISPAMPFIPWACLAPQRSSNFSLLEL